ncbi:unnamed protein product [Urochloa decumbens]|uniref:KIB1-4 beta-propeller domain-containing protein n=1 Tax=Urochloa decumbens TaxID=240449 RepID=A0ABC8ZGA6_9POAL
MSSSQQMPGLELPCLAFHCDRSTALISMHDHKRIAAAGDDILGLRNKAICPTAKGLLLVRDPDSMATYLLNPKNNGKVDLPPLTEVDDIVLIDGHCLLSDEPVVGPHSVVLLVEASENTFIWYCHPGDDQWSKYEYDIGSHVLPYPGDEEDQVEKEVICSIAAYQGKFYFNARAAELHVLDFSSHAIQPVLSAIDIDDTVADDGSYGFDEEHSLIFLVESGGELYMVRLLFVSTDEEDAWDEIGKVSVHRMDFAGRRWCNVHDLGGSSFLLSRFYFGASCLGAEHGLLPDHVYFVCEKTSSLQVFNVQEGTYDLHKFNEDPVVDKAFWLLPSKECIRDAYD